MSEPASTTYSNIFPQFSPYRDFLYPNGETPNALRGVFFNKPDPKRPIDERVLWNGRHAELHPKWYQVEKICKIVGPILLTVGLLLTVSAVLTALCFTATPIALVCVTLPLFTVGVVLDVVGSVFLSKKDFWQDPAFRIKKGQELLKEITEGSKGYLNVTTACGSLVDHYRLYTEADLQIALRKDAFELSYTTFLLKHGTLPPLDMLNRQALRRSCLIELEEQSSNENRPFALMNDFLGQLKGQLALREGMVSMEEINGLLRYDAEHCTFSEFLLRHSFQGIPAYLCHILNADLKAFLRPKVRDWFLAEQRNPARAFSNETAEMILREFNITF